jgi:hypothetical protein
MIFSHWAGKVSVRTQQYRLDDAGRLYDMTKDPGQEHDEAAEHPLTAARLREAVARWSGEMLPGLRDDDRPFPVGYREFPITWLPARDGRPHGELQRSANAPNCSYVTNWTHTSDHISWNIEVMTDGKYEAVAYYTCPAQDVGSTLELIFEEGQIQTKVTEANDPPLRGAEHDRVKRRGESYVKDFKPLKLGVIELTRGRGPLILRAVDIPGRSVIDLRAVELRLID